MVGEECLLGLVSGNRVWLSYFASVEMCQSLTAVITVLSALTLSAKLLKIATMVKLFLITSIIDPDEIMF